MRFSNLIVAATIVLAVGFTFTHQLSSTLAADDAVVADADNVYPVSYRLTDLPVWSQDGKTFNPTILMAYLKATVDADAWNTVSTMAPYKSCLVIATTSANHDRIKNVLGDLRKAALAPDAE